MSRAPPPFRKNDVKRLVLAAESAGKRVTHLKMENGVIDLTLADGVANKGKAGSTHAVDDSDTINPWDEVDLK
jgi:hypothetical protein